MKIEISDDKGKAAEVVAPAVAPAVTEDTGVSKALTDEIEGAVTTVVDEVTRKRDDKTGKFVKKEGEDEPPEDDLPPEKDQSGEDGSGDQVPEDGKKNDEPPKDDTDGKPGAITDEHIERAVKAGMTIADARSFQNAEVLERFCARLEEKKAVASAEKKDGDDVGKVEDPLSAIPDLDPAEYDEKVVNGFKAMKDLIRSQQQVIGELKSEGESRNGAWFENQIAALGEGFAGAVGAGDRSKLDPKGPQVAKRVELENKFKVLLAGYKAAGQDVDRGTIFKEAVSVVLGDVQAKAASDAKAKALADRAKQHVARPSGSKSGPTTDAFQDVAAMVDNKFFKK